MNIQTTPLWRDREDVTLTTFLHMRDQFIPDPKKKPAVIVCPGGAYAECPRHGNEGDPVAMSFAADGYQAFVLEYSVSSKAPIERTLFPAQILDLAKAVLVIHEHAEEWLVDVNKISIAGFSAGAHLCGMYATSWHTSLLSDYFNLDSEIFRPLCAILIYGLFDYEYQNQYTKDHPNPILPLDINVPVFGEQDPSSEKLRRYSPLYLLSEKTPPIFMAAATDDGMVPAMHSIRMAEKMQEMNLPYELHMFRYGDHGFSLGRNLFTPYRQDLVHACANWVPLAKTFLLHMAAPETTECEKNPFSFM
ncbi:MAG: alpha/beta hydrolase [Lachnospiraceae bacterium]